VIAFQLYAETPKSIISTKELFGAAKVKEKLINREILLKIISVFIGF